MVSRATRPNFQRDVHCVFGLPFDAVTQSQAVERVRAAALGGQRLFLSTPNLNFAAACRDDMAFRQSVVKSGLSTADGAPIIWLSRLMGIPLPERVTGSSLFDQLCDAQGPRVAVYFFGGPDGTAQAAMQRLNACRKPGVQVVGCSSPGFAPLAAISGPNFTSPINATQAQFVVVALGAKKGQAWIEQNWPALQAPVISHLGAVVNFVAGTVMRSPGWLQRSGMEWLWRIKEEPSLWRRYWHDGWRFLHFVATGALPLALMNRSSAVRAASALRVEKLPSPAGECRLRLQGEAANGAPLLALREAFGQACDDDQRVTLDLSQVTRVDSGFIALVQLLDGWQRQHSAARLLEAVPADVARTLRWAGAGYLLEPALG